MAPCKSPNHETRSAYDLILTVSDGKNESGNDDPRVDHKIGLRINVTDAAVSYRAILCASDTAPAVGEAVTLRVTLYDAPVALGELNSIFIEETNGVENGARRRLRI